MTKALILCAAMTLAASTAFAVGGIDLSLYACPANGGSSGGSIDCATAEVLPILATWSPAEDIPDLVGLEGSCVLWAYENLDQAGFWNFDPAGCNPGGLYWSAARPRFGCSGPLPYQNYLDAWSPADSAGATLTAVRVYPQMLRLTFTCHRSSPVAVTAGQQIFGIQILVDSYTSIESGGGSCLGCSTSPVFFWWERGQPLSAGAVQPASLTAPTGSYSAGQCVAFNNASCPHGDPVPARSRSWGQLKSLYR